MVTWIYPTNDFSTWWYRCFDIYRYFCILSIKSAVTFHNDMFHKVLLHFWFLNDCLTKVEIELGMFMKCFYTCIDFSPAYLLSNFRIWATSCKTKIVLSQKSFINICVEKKAFTYSLLLSLISYVFIISNLSIYALKKSDVSKFYPEYNKSTQITCTS